jgi:peptidoglycan/xylan/chitin deacetylase (PgdA/CDA1 family)
MRIPGLKAARLSARWVRSRFAAGVVVLGYHRVAEPDDDPFDLCVSPTHFGEQLDVIRRIATPVRLQDVVGTGGADPPARAVAITFDDGYLDILDTALPILRRHEVPATVFVVAGGLGAGFWWDRLASAFADAGGNGDGGAPVSDLHGTHLRLRGLPSADRERELRLLGAGSVAATGPARCLSVEELRELAQDPLIEIGAHTCSHPWLPALPTPERRQEIGRSKRDLEEITGRRVSAFSFPHGGMSRGLRQEVRAAAYSLACCSRNDVWRRETDPYAVPRFWVPDQPGAAFERWLRRWLCG